MKESEVNSMRYMNEHNTDEYYKILYKARYYYTQMNVVSPERFYRLIKELEDVMQLTVRVY